MGSFNLQEFVSAFIIMFAVIDAIGATPIIISLRDSGKVVKPMDMLNIPNGRIIFEGYLSVYTRIRKRQNKLKLHSKKTA